MEYSPKYDGPIRESVQVDNDVPTFWRWFFKGAGSGPGAKRLWDRWLTLHIGLGLTLSAVVPVSLGDLAQRALLPLMAIFIGLTFSWAGNAHSLMQSEEVARMAGRRAGGMAEYVYTFQLCILVMLSTIVFWVVPTLNLPYLIPGGFGMLWFEKISEIFLYSILSLALRTSWQAVLGANMLLLSRAKIRKSTD